MKPAVIRGEEAGSPEFCMLCCDDSAIIAVSVLPNGEVFSSVGALCGEAKAENPDLTVSNSLLALSRVDSNTVSLYFIVNQSYNHQMSYLLFNRSHQTPKSRSPL